MPPSKYGQKVTAKKQGKAAKPAVFSSTVTPVKAAAAAGSSKKTTLTTETVGTVYVSSSCSLCENLPLHVSNLSLSTGSHLYSDVQGHVGHFYSISSQICCLNIG
jgi:hypothetical protein